MMLVSGTAAPALVIFCIVSATALALPLAAIAWYQRRYGAPKGFDFCGDDAWRCVTCNAIFQDLWDLKPHRLAHQGRQQRRPEAAVTAPGRLTTTDL